MRGLEERQEDTDEFVGGLTALWLCSVHVFQDPRSRGALLGGWGHFPHYCEPGDLLVFSVNRGSPCLTLAQQEVCVTLLLFHQDYRKWGELWLSTGGLYVCGFPLGGNSLKF